MGACRRSEEKKGDCCKVEDNNGCHCCVPPHSGVLRSGVSDGSERQRFLGGKKFHTGFMTDFFCGLRTTMPPLTEALLQDIYTHVGRGMITNPVLMHVQ